MIYPGILARNIWDVMMITAPLKFEISENANEETVLKLEGIIESFWWSYDKIFGDIVLKARASMVKQVVYVRLK